MQLGSLRLRWAGFFGLLFLMAVTPLPAATLDFGVDPAHLGKGDWIYILSSAISQIPCGGTVAGLMAYEKSQGMNFIIVKAGESNVYFPSTGPPQFTASLVNAAHNAGLKIFGYTRSYGRDIPGELNIITNCLNLGCDGYVIDAESEWESSSLPNNTNAAVQLLRPLKTLFPTRLLAHSPFMYIHTHGTFPYLQFGLYCDVVMPQNYWTSFGITPTQCVADMDNDWNNWQNNLTGANRNAIKPICPIAQGWSPDPTNPDDTTTGAQIIEFHNACTNDAQPASMGGYGGVSYFRGELHSTNMWAGIASVAFAPPPSPPVITSQPSAQIIKSGSNAVFTVGVSGTVPFGYQWLFNGTNLSGATSNSYTVWTARPTNNGNYSVQITNAFGTNMSSNAVLKVIPQTPQLNRINVQPGGQMQVKVSGDVGLYYIVEGSSNLLTWFPVATNFNTNGIFVFSNYAGNYADRFYRLRISQ